VSQSERIGRRREETDLELCVCVFVSVWTEGGKRGGQAKKGKEKERDCDNIKSTRRLYFSLKILLLSIISDIFEE